MVALGIRCVYNIDVDDHRPEYLRAYVITRLTMNMDISPVSSSPFQFLPQELLSEIFGSLLTDKPALSVCSLVSRSWSLIAQKHLFYPIRLTPKNVPTKPHAKSDDVQVPDFEAFAQAIRALPALAPSVRELSIEGTSLSSRLVLRGKWEQLATFRSLNDDGSDLSSTIQHKLLYVSLGLDVLLSIAQGLPCLQRVTPTKLVMIATPLPAHDTIMLDCLELRLIGFRQPENVFDMFLIFRPADVDLSFFFEGTSIENA